VTGHLPPGICLPPTTTIAVIYCRLVLGLSVIGSGFRVRISAIRVRVIISGFKIIIFYVKTLR